MTFKVSKNTVLFPIIIGLVLVMSSCANLKRKKHTPLAIPDIETHTHDLYSDPIIGANQMEVYLPSLKNKCVGIVANQTSVIFKPNGHTHLVDSLSSLNIDIKSVFAPEHGFRGKADAGEQIIDGVDMKTGIPLVSLYGNNKKPNVEQMHDLQVVVFDIQDVGVRFYTYISTLHYVMEACAEARIQLIVLDRPNPNGHYIDGPILEKEHQSFIGMHPIPVVHGMTIGEYAKMINGERWLKGGIECDLTVIPIKNYKRKLPYSLPIKPSPNLPNDQSINLYPSLCFFEGTNVSVGRGTNLQFQIFGSPFLSGDAYNFQFTPQPNEGAKKPLYENKVCFGKNLSAFKHLHSLNLDWVIDAYNNTTDKTKFFDNFFTKLAGTKKLREQIEAGLSEREIKSTWQNDLKLFKTTREKYLMYH